MILSFLVLILLSEEQDIRTMNFGIEDFAESILDKTCSIENNIIQHFKPNIPNNTRTLDGHTSKVLSTLLNADSPLLSIPNRNATLSVVQSAPRINESYYDYLDDVLAPPVSNLTEDSCSGAIPPGTSMPSAPRVPDDWNNITVQLNQTWIQRTDWGEFILHNGGSVLIITILCIILGCFGLFRLYHSLKGRKVYRKYSLVYPDETVHSF